MGSRKVSPSIAVFPFRQPGLAVVLLAAGLAAPMARAEPPAGDADQAVRDAWLDGRLETAYALNSELGGFDIRTDVTNGIVRLSGSVNGEIARALAAEIAEGLPGVAEVENRLTVQPVKAPVRAAGEEETRTFAQWIEDVTDAARVKRNLVANGNTRDLAIGVETRNHVVTLKGNVSSRKEQMLAEMIARNTDGIASVRNQLAIDEQP